MCGSVQTEALWVSMGGLSPWAKCQSPVFHNLPGFPLLTSPQLTPPALILIMNPMNLNCLIVDQYFPGFTFSIRSRSYGQLL